MNYGYNSFMPYGMMQSIPKKGIFSQLLGGINISSILNNTQRTLNIVNQAIPVIKQVQPVMKNAKTMFKVMNEFKKTEEIPVNNTALKENIIKDNVSEDVKIETNGPVFFM